MCGKFFVTDVTLHLKTPVLSICLAVYCKQTSGKLEWTGISPSQLYVLENKGRILD